MALSNNLAPPFYPSAAFAPSISPHAAPWHFASHLTLIAPRTPVGERMQLSSFIFLFWSFMTKASFHPLLHPSTLSVSTLSPHPQQPLALSAKPDRCSPISSHHKSSLELATNTSAMLIYGRCPPRLSQKEAAKCCRLNVDGIDFLIESLLKVRGPTFTSYLWRERDYEQWVWAVLKESKGPHRQKNSQMSRKGYIRVHSVILCAFFLHYFHSSFYLIKLCSVGIKTGKC